MGGCQGTEEMKGAGIAAGFVGVAALMSRPACLAVWPGGEVGSKAWAQLYDCVLRRHICQRMAP